MDVDGATKLLLGVIRTPGISEQLCQHTVRVCQEMPIEELLWFVNREPLKGVDRLTERRLGLGKVLRPPPRGRISGSGANARGPNGT